MNMRSMVKEIAIVLVLLFVISNIISYIRKPELGSTKLPKIELKLIDGNIFKLQEGKPVVLHFWATSCPACKLEAPNIETISKEYDVLTIAVNSGTNEQIKAYMEESGLSFNVFNDEEGAACSIKHSCLKARIQFINIRGRCDDRGHTRIVAVVE